MNGGIIFDAANQGELNVFESLDFDTKQGVTQDLTRTFTVARLDFPKHSKSLMNILSMMAVASLFARRFAIKPGLPCSIPRCAGTERFITDKNLSDLARDASTRRAERFSEIPTRKEWVRSWRKALFVRSIRENCCRIGKACRLRGLRCRSIRRP